MRLISWSYVLVYSFVADVVVAQDIPTRGKLLVATDEVRGPAFAKSVILLLQYDETGTMGLVINRPIDAVVNEAMHQQAELDTYDGGFFWGGPVLPHTLRALLHTKTPPDDAVKVFDTVYLVNIDQDLLAVSAYAANLRLFVGYAGWAAGQLEYELAMDSWSILPATAETVFTEDSDEIWQKISLPREYRASDDKRKEGAMGALVPRRFSRQIARIYWLQQRP